MESKHENLSEKKVTKLHALTLKCPWNRQFDRRFILKTDYCCFLHTMLSLQSNRPPWMNSITHTVISLCNCRVIGDSHMGIHFYNSTPSKSRHESEIVEKYSPQDKCDRHLKYEYATHCWATLDPLVLPISNWIFSHGNRFRNN